MKISIPISRRPSTGYVLLLVLSSLAILMAVFASIMFWSASNAKITLRNNLFNQAQNAAESATENIAANMVHDFTYANLLSANAYTGLFPSTNGWPIYYQFSDTNGILTNAASVYIGTTPTNATTLNSQFAGLYGFQQPCIIASTATPLGQGQNLSATVCQIIDFTLIPLFQYAIFYNMDLEINPGAGMTINGRVHANGNIFATGSGSGSAQLFFNTNVDASGYVTNRPNPTNSVNSTRSGNVDYVLNINNPLGGSDTMSLPIAGSTNNSATNVLAILNSPPPTYATPFLNSGYPYAGTSTTPAAYTTNGEVFLENEADLIITNPASAIASANGSASTNIVIYYQNQNSASSPGYLTPIQPDVPVVTMITNNGVRSTNVNYLYYSFVTNVSFYDFRESKTVQAVQIDVNLLNIWLTNSIKLGGSNIITLSGVITNLVLGGVITNVVAMRGSNITANIMTTNNSILLGGNSYNQINTTGSTSKSSWISSIFIADSVVLKSSQLPAVRMVNGSRLPPNGLTVATAAPIYVKGNYNITTNASGTPSSTALGDTSYTSPAALMGDSVTILSTNWSDSYNSGTALSSRTVTAANTIINAATLEGIVPSNSSTYSGGVENFLRLLENWSSSNNKLTYNGSIVVMFPSQFATNVWQTTGNYYNPPNRQWGFDVNFNSANKLPPITPKFHAIIRSTWSTW